MEQGAGFGERRGILLVFPVDLCTVREGGGLYQVQRLESESESKSKPRLLEKRKDSCMRMHPAMHNPTLEIHEARWYPSRKTFARKLNACQSHAPAVPKFRTNRPQCASR